MDKIYDFFDSIGFNLNEILMFIVQTVIIIIVMMIAKKFASKVIDKMLKKSKSKRESTSLIFIKKVASGLIFVIGAMIILSQFEFLKSVMVPILSGAGIVALVAGIAAQDSLSNFFGSLGIVLSDPFEIGDFVRCVPENISGEVEDITFRHTVIRTIENKRLIVPNSVMNRMIVENFNHSDAELCLFMEYSISYDSDMDKAMEIIKEEMSSMHNPNKKGKDDIEFPKVRISRWADSSIVIRAWVWGKDSADAYENAWKLNKVLKERFDNEGINIPYPHMNVIVDETEKAMSKKKK